MAIVKCPPDTAPLWFCLLTASCRPQNIWRDKNKKKTFPHSQIQIGLVVFMKQSTAFIIYIQQVWSTQKMLQLKHFFNLILAREQSLPKVQISGENKTKKKHLEKEKKTQQAFVNLSTDENKNLKTQPITHSFLKIHIIAKAWVLCWTIVLIKMDYVRLPCLFWLWIFLLSIWSGIRSDSLISVFPQPTTGQLEDRERGQLNALSNKYPNWHMWVKQNILSQTSVKAFHQSANENNLSPPEYCCYNCACKESSDHRTEDKFLWQRNKPALGFNRCSSGPATFNFIPTSKQYDKENGN